MRSCISGNQALMVVYTRLFFGSENLTAAQNIELGIRIDNNNEILGKLTLFFREIEEEATEIFRR